MELAELALALRAYSSIEHGKRARQHAEIVREIFRNPEALAKQITEALQGAAFYVCVGGDPEKAAELLNSLHP